MSNQDLLNFLIAAVAGPVVTALLKTKLGHRLAGLGLPVNALVCLAAGAAVWAMEGCQEGHLLPMLGLSLKAALAGSAVVAMAEHPTKKREAAPTGTLR